MPPNAQHLQYLDGWRGLAIFFLLIGHFFQMPGLNFGAVGVNLFFVLSGVLMARLLFIQQVPIPEFYRRRIARIFPAVIVFLIVMVGSRLLLGQNIAWSDVVAAALFVNNYVVGELGANAMPFGHFWSLCVEEHSYIVLSVLALAVRRHIGRAVVLVPVAALIIGLTGLSYALRFSGAELYELALHSEVAAFGIFASAALLMLLQGRKIPRLPAVAYPALVVLGISMHWWSMPAPVKMLAGVGIFALTVNLLFNAPPSVHAALSIKPLRVLGLWSFSIYIWQQPFYLLSKYHGLPAVLGLLLAIGCGVASFYLVENPARNWLNRKWGRKPARIEPAEVTPA